MISGSAGAIHVIRLRTTKLFELFAKFPNAGIQRTDARIVFRIDLAEPLKLRLCGDHLAYDCSCGVQHCLSFLLDVESVVLAGELSELVRGIVQVLLRYSEAFLEEHAFAVRRRSRELGNERVQLVDISAC